MSKFISLLILIAAGAAVWLWVLRPVLAPMGAGVGAGPAIVGQPTGADTTGQDAALRAAAGQQVAYYLARWQRRNYAGMYALLDRSSRAHITRDHFLTRYAEIATQATISGLNYHVISATVAPPEAMVRYSVAISTTAVGVVAQNNTMRLQQEGGAWRVRWSPSLIFTRLRDPYYIHMIPADPVRGAIYDRTGQPLAALGYKVRIDVVPVWINDEKGLLAFLSRFLNQDATVIRAKWPADCIVGQAAPPQRCTWRWPVGVVKDTALAAAGSELSQQESNGIDTDYIKTPMRIYPNGAVAAQVLGYVQNGHGQLGLEAGQDTVLGGQAGMTLAVTDRPADDARVVAKIAQRPAVPGADLHVTLDVTLQKAAEAALGPRKGAVVAIDPRTGAVLALVSHPGFDPNGLSGFGVSQATYNTWVDPQVRAFFNRATSGVYPLGSVFKIVSMAAALQKGLYSEHAPLFTSTGTWSKLGWQYAKHDWLPGGHGQIDLHEALVQSCDDCFYDIGLGLHKQDPNALTAMGRAFGFGKATGLPGLVEADGTMPGPTWKKAVLKDTWWSGDAVNLSIGQGYLLVTPLQVAHMLAAVAAGGTLRQPYLVDSTTQADGTPIHQFRPITSGRLPVSADTLAVIRRAMAGVTTEPFGTAIAVFRNYPYPVEGKTGTAEAPGGGKPEAWFGAITPRDNPRLALAVIVEHGGEGAVVAAPIARDVISAFYKSVDKPPKPTPATLTVP